MKWSNHTIILENYPNAGECLLYSTRTQSLVKVPHTLKETVDRFEDPSLVDLRTRFDNDLEQLYRLGLVVRDENEDIEKLKNFLVQLKHGAGQTLPVQVLTTYACNFKCTYCFQESSRTMVKMDRETQDLTIAWMKRRIERLGYKNLYLTYYGGEPLLNPDAIRYISTEMQQWCRRKGLGFRFSLQTNGYLLTPQRIEEYLPLGLVSARISVDGMKETHDRNRPLRGGGGTFERVVGNIVTAVDKIKVHISCTHEDGDIEPIIRLLDHFQGLGVLHKLGEFLFSPSHATLGPKGNPEAIQRRHCQCNFEDETLKSSTERLRREMIARGLPVKSGMSVSTCPLTRENSGVTVDQHGRLYRCNSMLGHPEFAVGDVRHDDFNAKQKEFRELNVWKQCPQDCTYMPMCSGGCRLMAFLDHQTFTVPACKKPFLNKLAPELIKQEYEKLIASRAGAAVS